ncbi:MAG TPA: nuclear transport factor 2 family protein [Acidimicrobiales bacterium]
MSDNVELIRDAYDAFGRGDIEAVLAAMHRDIAWNEAEHSPYHKPGGHHGPGDVLENVFARIPGDFDDFEVIPRTFHDAGDTVVVEGRYRATPTATSDPLDVEVCHVWTVRDGKVLGFQQYTDTWQFAQVSGNRPE